MGKQAPPTRAAPSLVRALRDARGALLFATGTSLNQRRRGVNFGRRSGVPIARRLTGIVEAVIVHVGNARRERRMMHQDHGRPIRLCSERRVEPAEPLGAQHPAMLAGDERVERDKPQRVIFDRVLQVAIGRQVAGTPKSLAQRLSSVMIAGDDTDRHRQPREQMAQLLVFLGLAVIDKIAGHDGDIGPWHQRVQSRDCTRQIWRGIELARGPRGIRRSALHGAAEQLARRDDVGIRELGKDHVLSATRIASW